MYANSTDTYLANLRAAYERAVKTHAECALSLERSRQVLAQAEATAAEAEETLRRARVSLADAMNLRSRAAR